MSEIERILDVRHLKTDFFLENGPVTAVNDVSFHVNKGETFGLIGESGSGKSVTLRSILRLLRKPGKVVGGQIIYKERDLCRLSEQEMRGIRGREIGMIFQEPMTTLNPVQTIGSQIMESFKKSMTKEEKEKRAVELMQLVGIPSAEERLRSYAHQFSGGMRQRAMIAIALASEPSLLLADEPTTALDVTIQDQIIRLLRKLQRDLGMSMILVTHDLGVASEICDRIAVMYGGRIMEQAPAEEIFTHPKHPYTYDLMRSVPSMERKGSELYSIEGTPPSLDNMPAGCPFAPRCELADDRCREDAPELTSVSGEEEHIARCWHIDRLIEQGKYLKV